LTPHSIALVGATENSFWSRTIVENLTNLGFTGEIYLVHPRQPRQFDRPCFPRVTAIPGPVDHAYVMTGTQHALTVLQDCAEKGVPGVTMLTAGFKETDDVGARRQAELVELCRERGIALLGPNCLGFVNALQPVPAFALLMGEPPIPGGVGVVLQSGALLYDVHQVAWTRNIGLSYLISSGNEAILDSADFLRFLVEDPATKVVGALIEGIRRPAAFAEVAERALELGKPIVVLKTGRSAAASRVAIAHTAALTGSDAVVDALFKQLGVLRVSSVEELVETLGFLQAYGWPSGRRAGVVTPSGGCCSVISDLCYGTSIELPDFGAETKQKIREILPEFGTPQNPLDTTGVIVLDASLIPRTAEVVASDPELDLLVVVQDPPRGPGPVPGRAEERVQLLATTLANSPKFACAVQRITSELTPYARRLFAEAGVFLANGLPQLVGSLDRAIRYGEHRRRFLERASQSRLSKALAEVAAPSTGERKVLDEAEALTLLRRHAVDCVAYDVAANSDEAAAIADRLGYPVVVKVLSAEVPHKSDVGGVALGLTSEAAVRAACSAIAASVRERLPSARIDGFLVAEQVTDAIEMIAGISVDPMVGPVVMVGVGGIFAEALGDVSFRLPPFDEDEASRMLGELRGRRLLNGGRGRPRADVPALARALVKLGSLALAEQDRLVDLDVNPLFVLPWGHGTKAGDALLVLDAGVGTRTQHLAPSAHVERSHFDGLPD
jgi:acyl-CoA synthetase (NDP forming)